MPRFLKPQEVSSNVDSHSRLSEEIALLLKECISRGFNLWYEDFDEDGTSQVLYTDHVALGTISLQIVKDDRQVAPVFQVVTPEVMHSHISTFIEVLTNSGYQREE